MSKLIDRALEIATWWHTGISRKTGGPYIVHPVAVAEIIKNESSVMRAAALLHDVLEDKNMDGKNINEYELLELLIFENSQRNKIEIEEAIKVVALVKELTNVYTHEAYPITNRATRNIFELARLEQISAEAQTIKVADIIDNTKDLDKLGGFARKSLTEAEDKLSVLTRAKKEYLDRAYEQLKQWEHLK